MAQLDSSQLHIGIYTNKEALECISCCWRQGWGWGALTWLVSGPGRCPWISHCVARLAAPPSWVGMNHHFVKPGVKDSLSWVADSYAKQGGASDLSGEGVGGRSGLAKKGSSEPGIHVFSICPPLGEVLPSSPTLLLFLMAGYLDFC